MFNRDKICKSVFISDREQIRSISNYDLAQTFVPLPDNTYKYQYSLEFYVKMFFSYSIWELFFNILFFC